MSTETVSTKKMQLPTLPKSFLNLLVFFYFASTSKENSSFFSVLEKEEEEEGVAI